MDNLVTALEAMIAKQDGFNVEASAGTGWFRIGERHAYCDSFQYRVVAE